MGQKDLTEKLMLDYADVFADIINVFLFDGKREIDKDDLVETSLISQYKADDSKIHEQERDVSKYWKKGNCVISLLGVELQSNLHPYMPARIINYDGASYRSQLLKNGDEKLPEYIYPTVTIVLNFNKQKWNKPTRLLDCMSVDERLKPYVNDYKINVFDIAHLDDETIDKFQSDFKYVAEFFSKTGKNPEYRPSEDTIKYKDAVMKLLKAVTNNNEFTILFDEAKMEGADKPMCFVLDGIEKAGKIKGKIELLLEMGTPIKEIVNRLGVTEKEVLKVQEEMQQKEM